MKPKNIINLLSLGDKTNISPTNINNICNILVKTQDKEAKSSKKLKADNPYLCFVKSNNSLYSLLLLLLIWNIKTYNAFRNICGD